MGKAILIIPMHLPPHTHTERSLFFGFACAPGGELVVQVTGVAYHTFFGGLGCWRPTTFVFVRVLLTHFMAQTLDLTPFHLECLHPDLSHFHSVKAGAAVVPYQRASLCQRDDNALRARVQRYRLAKQLNGDKEPRRWQLGVDGFSQ
ncbi:hypothetical protein CEXT_663851 [Caerostris extrusa]|uniref:Uncharacterized protein n=1 Tax=Caerostris extrusa TaxID=172846 RepID=A0AAV4M6C6_CAEEX|nr:hypothetical protein CEXT_663851 [Caerostris extrusa]